MDSVADDDMFGGEEVPGEEYDEDGADQANLDLFGEDEDAGSGAFQEESSRRRDLEYEEGGGQVQPPLQSTRRGDIELANFGTWKPGKGSGGFFHLKLPGFLAMEARPFDPSDFEKSHKEQSQAPRPTPARRRSMFLPPDEEEEKDKMMPDENVIRWQWTKDAAGNIKKESNARFVRWSDGSVTLQIGDEQFRTGFSMSPFAESDSSPQLNPNSTTPSIPKLPLSYLSAQHPYNGYQSISGVIQNLHLGTNEANQPAHKRYMAATAAEARKKAKVAVLRVDIDPERQREEREREEREKGKRGIRIGGAAATSPRKIVQISKKGSRRNGRSLRLQSEEADDDDDVDGEEGRSRKQQRSTREADYEDDDGFVVPDPSSEEEDEGDGEEEEGGTSGEEKDGSKRKRRPKKHHKRPTQEGDVEMDDIEHAEAELENQQRQKRMAKRYGQAPSLPKTDVASQGTQVKKMVIMSDEED
ncbi:Leo1-domain-containing protein [Atractiella rhizophila]|nr:Leo1-domain-containing protein [Atractiella rhizophila]